MTTSSLFHTMMTILFLRPSPSWPWQRFVSYCPKLALGQSTVSVLDSLIGGFPLSSAWEYRRPVQPWGFSLQLKCRDIFCSIPSGSWPGGPSRKGESVPSGTHRRASLFKVLRLGATKSTQWINQLVGQTDRATEFTFQQKSFRIGLVLLLSTPKVRSTSPLSQAISCSRCPLCKITKLCKVPSLDMPPIHNIPSNYTLPEAVAFMARATLCFILCKTCPRAINRTFSRVIDRWLPPRSLKQGTSDWGNLGGLVCS